MLKNKNILHPEFSYKLNGLFFAVHNKLGRFCNEKQYGDALENELKIANIDYKREISTPVSFDGESKRRQNLRPKRILNSKLYSGHSGFIKN